MDRSDDMADRRNEQERDRYRGTLQLAQAAALSHYGSVA